jgi:ABC-type nickel/cobalt efflux system permease component RcnA
MNTLFVRTAVLLLHAIANFALVSYLLNFDISGKWVSFIGFILLILVLVYLFIRHIVSYIYFVKNKST